MKRITTGCGIKTPLSAITIGGIASAATLTLFTCGGCDMATAGATSSGFAQGYYGPSYAPAYDSPPRRYGFDPAMYERQAREGEEAFQQQQFQTFMLHEMQKP